MVRNAFFLSLLISVANAQQYTISTVAGVGLQPFTGAGAPAVKAALMEPIWVAVDSAGNTFVSDRYYHQVFRIDANGTITVYAGSGGPGYSGDGGPAAAAQLYNPSGLAFDAAGNLYIADNGNGVVRQVTPGGTISTFASVVADGVALDTAGNLYLTQTGFNDVMMVNTAGAISAIAGVGVPGFAGDGGPATAAELYAPAGIKVDKAGNIYVADSLNNRIRKITPAGVISTFAGTGASGLSGDGARATAATLATPSDIAIDAAGQIYIADASNFRVRLVDTAGLIHDFAGGGTSFGDGPAALALLEDPTGIAVDNAGDVVTTLKIGKQVKRITAKGAVTTVAGVGPSTSGGDNIGATAAALLEPFGIVSDGAGNLYVSDVIDTRIRKVSASGTITTVAGNGLFGSSANNGLPAEVGEPTGLAMDGNGNLYYCQGEESLVRVITPQDVVKTDAGGGPANSLGDGGSATTASLRVPLGVAADGAGNLYIADTYNNRIRRVDNQGNITTFAGMGAGGYSGDNGPATSAQLYEPYQLAFDSSGNLYVADEGNNRIREIAPNGTITTVAGNGVLGFAGDGGPANAAAIAAPTGIAVDAAGNLYIACYLSATIRMVSAATGVISTIAGTGSAGFGGDGGPATGAQLTAPLSLALDGSGNIYFTDQGNYRVRMLTPAPSQ